MSVLKQVVLDISNINFTNNNDNFHFTDKVRNDVDSLTIDEINYIVSMSSRALSSNNLSDKVNFILTLWRFLNISIVKFNQVV